MQCGKTISSGISYGISDNISISGFVLAIGAGLPPYLAGATCNWWGGSTQKQVYKIYTIKSLSNI
jgi:hypothetical protein